MQEGNLNHHNGNTNDDCNLDTHTSFNISYFTSRINNNTNNSINIITNGCKKGVVVISISEARKHCGRFLNDTYMQHILIVEFGQEIGGRAQEAIESFNFRVVEKDMQQIQQIADMLSDSSNCGNCKCHNEKCFKNEQLKRKKRTIYDVMRMMKMMKIDSDTELAGISCGDILFDFGNLMVVSVMVVVLHHPVVIRVNFILIIDQLTGKSND